MNSLNYPVDRINQSDTLIFFGEINIKSVDSDDITHCFLLTFVLLDA